MNNRVRDGEATKKRIIKVAEKIFSEKGFNGTSIRDLANASGFSGPLILHHFKNKEGLYDAVRLALVKDYAPLFEDVGTCKEGLFEFIECIVRGVFEFHRDNPTVLRLMNWDRLNGFKKPWPKCEEFRKIFVEHIQKAMDEGEINSNFSAHFLGVMIGGMAHLWWEDHDNIMSRYIDDISDEKKAMGIDEKYVQQILAFVKKFIDKE
jgi:TetR/AcrR family transcriptional regulator